MENYISHFTASIVIKRKFYYSRNIYDNFDVVYNEFIYNILLFQVLNQYEIIHIHQVQV